MPVEITGSLPNGPIRVTLTTSAPTAIVARAMNSGEPSPSLAVNTWTPGNVVVGNPLDQFYEGWEVDFASFYNAGLTRVIPRVMINTGGGTPPLWGGPGGGYAGPDAPDYFGADGQGYGVPGVSLWWDELPDPAVAPFGTSSNWTLLQFDPRVGFPLSYPFTSQLATPGADVRANIFDETIEDADLADVFAPFYSYLWAGVDGGAFGTAALRKLFLTISYAWDPDSRMGTSDGMGGYYPIVLPPDYPVNCARIDLLFFKPDAGHATALGSWDEKHPSFVSDTYTKNVVGTVAPKTINYWDVRYLGLNATGDFPQVLADAYTFGVTPPLGYAQYDQTIFVRFIHIVGATETITATHASGWTSLVLSQLGQWVTFRWSVLGWTILEQGVLDWYALSAPTTSCPVPDSLVAPAPSLALGGQSDVGQDIACITDVGATLSLARGIRNIGNAIARRLITPRGGLFYDPNYGLDVRAYLNAGFTASVRAQIQSDVASEVSKDPRVEGATVTVAQDLATAGMQIAILCELAEGPYEFVFGVSALTVELLKQQALA